MKFKDANGSEMNVGSQSQSTINTVLGSIGALGALTMGGGLLGRGNRQSQNDGDRPVTRYEMGLIRESMAKDNEIALLKSQQYTDKVAADMERRQSDINREQAVYNGVNTATVQCLQRQIGQLLSITQMVVPNSNVSPGWGGVSIEPYPVVKGGTTQTSTQTQGGN